MTSFGEFCDAVVLLRRQSRLVCVMAPVRAKMCSLVKYAFIELPRMPPHASVKKTFYRSVRVFPETRFISQVSVFGFSLCDFCGEWKKKAPCDRISVFPPQILTIPVKAVIAVGTLSSSPKHIVLPQSFPVSQKKKTQEKSALRLLSCRALPDPPDDGLKCRPCAPVFCVFARVRLSIRATASRAPSRRR